MVTLIKLVKPLSLIFGILERKHLKCLSIQSPRSRGNADFVVQKTQIAAILVLLAEVEKSKTKA